MRLRFWLPILLALAAAAAAVWLAQGRLEGSGGAGGRAAGAERAVPVEVATVERGPIERRRAFTGTLEARAEFVVAPKVSGRIEGLDVDLADAVRRGQVVARLDNAEHVQAVTQAQADLAVAQANLAEAKSLLTIAQRELQRLDRLRERGVSSEAQLDVAKAEHLAKQAHVAVTRAQVTRARAELETARIRLGYTRVAADWRGGDDERVVAERYVDEGETVSANAPLLRIAELDPLTAVVFVTERDYALLRPGQRAVLATDAYPGEAFRGTIARIAPVFRESTRQARVELRVENPGRRLKPGMFVRATVVLERVEDAVIVPERALATREGREGVFVVADDGASVAWRPVRVGIRDGGRVQVAADGPGALGGPGTRVVTLGQQLIADGSVITVAEGGPEPVSREAAP
jgi:RND family efflux transporter MFP subunit